VKNEQECLVILCELRVALVLSVSLVCVNIKMSLLPAAASVVNCCSSGGGIVGRVYIFIRTCAAWP